jgi:SAM-dependent methyltransferase
LENLAQNSRLNDVKNLIGHIDYVDCNYCTSNDAKVVVSSEDGHDNHYGNVVRCKRCGLIYRNPRLTLSNPIYFGFNRPDSPQRMTRAREAVFRDIQRLASSFRKHNRILDIGSGQGFFLQICSENKWNVSGVEVVPQSVDFTRKQFGIEVFNGPLEEANFPRDHFDVITLINTLEHIHDPSSVLSEAFRILRPEGALLIRTPNATIHVYCKLFFSKLHQASKRIKDLDPSCIYTYAYDRKTIKNYLVREGFEDIRIWNARLRWGMGSSHLLSFKRMSGAACKGLANSLCFLSRGRLLIAPSLLVVARKPSQ